jgi:N-acetylneuraminic acid mutarotase
MTPTKAYAWRWWLVIPSLGALVFLLVYEGLLPIRRNEIARPAGVPPCRTQGDADQAGSPPCGWEQVKSSVSPPARRSAAMAYDPDHGVAALFGGVAAEHYFGDTWVFNARTGRWKEMKPRTSPSPRAASLMVYDTSNKKFVIFGGFVFVHAVAYKDTWAYDYGTNTWQEMKPAVSPNIRASYALAHNEDGAYTLLFGGFHEAEGADVWYNDTWKYDWKANTWMKLETRNAPTARGAPAFAYDSSSKVFVLFGGFHGREYLNDTWIFDPKKGEWNNTRPARPPAPRRTRMTYDAGSRRVVLFGGEAPIGGGSINKERNPFHLDLRDDTWTYDAGTNAWERLATDVKPGKRGLHSIVYDRVNSATILFGGTDGGENGRLGDTWLLRLSPKAP